MFPVLASTTPGEIAFTLMPCLIRSSPADWVRLITVALVAQLMVTSDSPRRPAWLAMLMIFRPAMRDHLLRRRLHGEAACRRR